MKDKKCMKCNKTATVKMSSGELVGYFCTDCAMELEKKNISIGLGDKFRISWLSN